MNAAVQIFSSCLDLPLDLSMNIFPSLFIIIWHWKTNEQTRPIRAQIITTKMHNLFPMIYDRFWHIDFASYCNQYWYDLTLNRNFYHKISPFSFSYTFNSFPFVDYFRLFHSLLMRTSLIYIEQINWMFSIFPTNFSLIIQCNRITNWKSLIRIQKMLGKVK